MFHDSLIVAFTFADTDVSNALVAHNGLHVCKVEVNDCGDVDQIGNSLYCLLKDFVGLHQGFRHAGTLVHNFQNLVIRDNDQSIHAVTQLLDTGHRIAHIGIGEGKGDDKAVMAVKAAVESPLLETTIAGATDIIINVSGDISMFDASDAVDYVREITGDDVNIIFGAMYDSNQADYCRITVIATGIEETPASRFGTSFARKPITPSVGQTGMKTTVSATGANTTRPYNSALQQPVHPGAASNAELKKPAGINGIQPAPTVLRSKVQERDLKIPDFLQKK